MPVIPSEVSRSMRTKAALSMAPLAGRGGYLMGVATGLALNPLILRVMNIPVINVCGLPNGY